MVTKPLAPSDAVAITFDDGPHPEGTPAILEILARHGAVATFFVIGEQWCSGHSCCNGSWMRGTLLPLHGYHHRLHLRRSAAELAEDFTRGTAAIEDAVGQTPQFSPAPVRDLQPGEPEDRP